MAQVDLTVFVKPATTLLTMTTVTGWNSQEVILSPASYVTYSTTRPLPVW